MAEDIKAPSTAKKVRRGINNETRSTSNLKFTEADATRSKLFMANVKDVVVSWANIGADAKGMIGEFAGHAIPRLDVHFVSTHAKEAEQRHVHLTINPIASNTETIPGGSNEFYINATFAWVKHILEVYYLKGRELTAEEEDALSLSYVDYEEDEQGTITYVPVEVDDVIAGWRSVFENAVAMLNGTWSTGSAEASGKPCYKDVNGKPITAFIKLLRYFRNKQREWKAVGQNGDLAFPSFVGEGCIEIASATEGPKILKVNPITESITPKQEAEVKAPSMPGNLPGGGIQAAGYAPAPYAGDGNAYNEAASDMPF